MKQNIGESIQIRAAKEIFWAVKRVTKASNKYCASATVQALEPYNLKCFDISIKQAESVIRADRHNRTAPK